MTDSLWCDITTDDADTLADFYVDVMGWKKESFDMGGYNDFVMMKPDGSAAGGICHKKGNNSAMPAGWIPYFTVQDIENALASALKKGGEKVGDVRHMGNAKYCVIKDPTGAYCALYEDGAE